MAHELLIFGYEVIMQILDFYDVMGRDRARGRPDLR